MQEAVLRLWSSVYIRKIVQHSWWMLINGDSEERNGTRNHVAVFFLQRECSLSFDVDISVGKSVSTEMWIHGRSFATQHRYHAAKMIAAHVYTYLFHEYVCENTRARVNAELARRHVRLEISTELPMKRFHPRSRPIATMSSDVLL